MGPPLYSRSSTTVSLPLLPDPSQKPQGLFRCLLLADVLNRMGDDDLVACARRNAQLDFNRVGGDRVSGHLRVLVEDGWLLVAERTRGKIPHKYSRGPLLRRRTALWEDWKTISATLWDDGGLLTRFRGSPAFGVGCLGVYRVLVLAVIVCGPPVPKSILRGFLGPWMSRQTVTTATNVLVDAGLIELGEDGFVPVDGWCEVLGLFVSESAAGADRHDRLGKTIRHDRAGFDELLRSGDITPEERGQLLLRPCVRCGGRSNNLEHFPPKKYNRSNSPFLVWSICGECNWSFSVFIRSLDRPEPPQSIELSIAEGVDPGDFLRASTEVGLRRFYLAAENGDLDDALNAIMFCWTLWRRLNETTPISRKRLPGTRRPRSSRTLSDRGGASPGSRLPY